MSQYNQSAKQGLKIQIAFIIERMEELNINTKRLSEVTGIAEKRLNSDFRLTTDIKQIDFLKICGALKLNPYLIPAEINQQKFKRLFFN